MRTRVGKATILHVFCFALTAMLSKKQQQLTSADEGGNLTCVDVDRHQKLFSVKLLAASKKVKLKLKWQLLLSLATEKNLKVQRRVRVLNVHFKEREKKKKHFVYLV